MGRNEGDRWPDTSSVLRRYRLAEVKNPGYFPDGAGLYLQVSPASSKSWIFRFSFAGRSREMGLGSLSTRTLAQARDKARECRSLIADGIDPIEYKNASRAQRQLDEAKAMTFQQAAEKWIATHEDGWSEKHRVQTRSSLESYAFPLLGEVSVAAVDLDLVLRVIEPIWKTKTTTADRVRGRIENSSIGQRRKNP